MASRPSDAPTDANMQSLLRTGPESTLNARTETPVALKGDLSVTTPLFPPPELADDVVSALAGWDRFATMAIHIDIRTDIRTDIRIDQADPAAEEHDLNDAIEACLASMARNDETVWTRWDSALYGFAVKGADAESADRLARQIQEELAEKYLDTVSIGISEFPLHNYDRETALRNACKALDHAAFFGPGSTVRFDAVSLNISGDHAYQGGRMQAAIDEYRAALRLDEKDVNVHNSLGVCLAQTGEVDAARTCFETSLSIDPEEAMAAYNLGVLSLLEQKKQDAMRHFQTAYAADDHIFDIPFQIGKLLTEETNFEEALGYLESAVLLCQTSAPAYSCLGQCLKELGRDREAINAYKKAVKINPNDAATLSTLAILYDARGENPEICLTFGRQSVDLAPENGEFRMRLADLLQKYNLLDQALSEYESAAELGQASGHQIAEIQARLEANEEKKKRCA